MTALLYRLGSWTTRRRKTVILGWVALLVLLGVLGTAFAGPTSSAFTIPGTQSQQALDLLAEKFPGTGGASARIVVAAPAGHVVTEAPYEQAGTESLALMAKAPQVLAVLPLSAANLSTDGRIAFVNVQYSVPDRQGDASRPRTRWRPPPRRPSRRPDWRSSTPAASSRR